LDHILLPAILDKAASTKSPEKKRASTPEYPVILSDIIKLLKKNFVKDTVVHHFMHQVFFFMDAQVFNTLLRRTDLYNATSGFQMKMAISQVEDAMGKVDKQLSAVAQYVSIYCS
jgi:hypothetical protein